MANDNFELEDFDGELNEEDNTLIMTDEDGNDVEFTIVSMLENGGVNYLLAIESEMLHDDEASATILKEVAPEGEDEAEDMFFEPIVDEDEFNSILALFQEMEDVE